MRKNVLKMVVLLLIGGMTYFCIEMLWRGYSHISMFFVGGICFIGIGAINEYFPWSLGVIQQSFIGADFVTFMELVSGILLNIKLNLNVWNYSVICFVILWGISVCRFSLLGLLYLLWRLLLMIICDIGFSTRKSRTIS